MNFKLSRDISGISRDFVFALERADEHVDVGKPVWKCERGEQTFRGFM